MIKIIAKRSLKSELYYKSIGDNITADSWSQLGIMIDIINTSIFSKLIGQEHERPEYKIGEFNDILIRYEDLMIDDFYIAFYDSILDDFWENFCKKKYGREGFVWDEQTPMLRFSKLNFEHVIKQWLRIVNERPEYLLITQDDTGWIDLQGKNELTVEELNLIETYKQRQEELKAAEIKRINTHNHHIH